MLPPAGTAPLQGIFHNTTMTHRTFVSHQSLSLFDPVLDVALYDMRQYDKHPGDSYMFK